jgi:hypothetical protein
VIDVGDLEWAIPVTGRALLQLPKERLKLVGSAAALPLFCLFDSGALMNSETESLIARSGDLLALAVELKRGPCRIHGLPLQCFVVLIYELSHQRSYSFLKSIGRVAHVRFGQEAQVPAPVLVLCNPVGSYPPS